VPVVFAVVVSLLTVFGVPLEEVVVDGGDGQYRRDGVLDLDAAVDWLGFVAREILAFVGDFGRTAFSDAAGAVHGKLVVTGGKDSGRDHAFATVATSSNKGVVEVDAAGARVLVSLVVARLLDAFVDVGFLALYGVTARLPGVTAATTAAAEVESAGSVQVAGSRVVVVYEVCACRGGLAGA